jgi:hypothetical protein
VLICVLEHRGQAGAARQRVLADRDLLLEGAVRRGPHRERQQRVRPEEAVRAGLRDALRHALLEDFVRFRAPHRYVP